ncbi:MAG TPA: helix-turn-helix transcriptional regulator [Blastocatellia bacterium]|nr:helix-turn-helix transcriptional regulator [Blastocatellia bacterium]
MESQKEFYANQFADWVIAQFEKTGLKQAEIARRSKVSPQTISTIRNKKPHHLTSKLILPERETVDAIADAFRARRSEARKAAGYDPDIEEQNGDATSDAPAARKRRLARIEEEFEYFDETEQVTADVLLDALEKVAERSERRRLRS